MGCYLGDTFLITSALRLKHASLVWVILLFYSQIGVLLSSHQYSRVGCMAGRVGRADSLALSKFVLSSGEIGCSRMDPAVASPGVASQQAVQTSES